MELRLSCTNPNISLCTGCKVNVDYEQIASGVKVWFQIHDLWILETENCAISELRNDRKCKYIAIYHKIKYLNGSNLCHQHPQWWQRLFHIPRQQLSWVVHRWSEWPLDHTWELQWTSTDRRATHYRPGELIHELECLRILSLQTWPPGGRIITKYTEFTKNICFNMKSDHKYFILWLSYLTMVIRGIHCYSHVSCPWKMLAKN